MKRLRFWLLPLLALLVAGAMAVLRSDTVTHSRLPLADNKGPLGSAVLATYLREGGHTVLTESDGLPDSRGGTWLLAAPTARTISRVEVAQLRAFVAEGGTLVFLSGDPKAQPHLSDWLGLSEGPRMERTSRALTGEDPGGVTLDLLARDDGGLRFAVGRSIVAEGAVPVAATGEAVGLWRRAEGRGAVWIAAGPSLIENARLALDDNLAFWAALGEPGPITWIETFHISTAPPSSASLWAFALQLLLCLVVGALCFGPRMGPPRPIPEVRHRSSMESVRALGWLLRRSRVEPELAASLRERLDAAAGALSGVPRGLGSNELASVLHQRSGLPLDEARSLIEALDSAASARSLRPSAFAALARRAARLERALHGGRAGSGLPATAQDAAPARPVT